MHWFHIVAAIGEHCRCNPCAVIEAIAFQYIAAAQYARAFLFAFGDIAQHVIAMREADQRAEVSLRIENVARANALNAPDAAKMVQAKPCYVEDRVTADACVIKMLRSPHAHALITHLDVSKAEALPGVVHVITHLNCWQAPRH